MTTLVVGARGHVGRAVLDLLLAAGEPVRASARTPQNADLPAGVTVVAADLTDPNSLRAALDGVSRLFLYAPSSSTDLPAIVRVLEEAVLEQTVLLSSGSVLLDWTAGNAITEHHRTIENAFADSDLAWIPIRPLVLATNDLNWAGPIRKGHPVGLVHPDAVTAPIHERDIAAVAVAALTGTADPAAASQLLTGGELLSQRRRVALIAEALERPIEVEELTEEDARARFGHGGHPEEVEAILAFIRNAAHGGSPATDTLKQLLGRAPLSFASWASEHTSAFA